MFWTFLVTRGYHDQSPVQILLTTGPVDRIESGTHSGLIQDCHPTKTEILTQGFCRFSDANVIPSANKLMRKAMALDRA